MLIKKILIGVDNSKFADNAAQYGFDIAHKFNARVGLVHIVEPVMASYNNADPLTGASDVSLADVELIDIQNKASKTIIDNVIKKYGGEGLEISHFNDFGDTAAGIITCSQEFGADMIVIGTHSRSGLDRLLMGSVAEHVVRNATVPVLVVPFNEEE